MRLSALTQEPRNEATIAWDHMIQHHESAMSFYFQLSLNYDSSFLHIGAVFVWMRSCIISSNMITLILMKLRFTEILILIIITSFGVAIVSPAIVQFVGGFSS